MATILVVDDVGDSRYLLVTLLEGHGYHVVAASNGAEALEFARQTPPDLVLSDLLMPVMDGFELCRQWKQDPRLQRIPFVVYTATYTDPRDEQLVLSLGADRFLLKPQQVDQMLEAVREALQSPVGARAKEWARPAVEERESLTLHQQALARKLERKVAQLEAEMARRSELERGLRESERKFRLLADRACDVVWSMELDGRLTYVSPAVERVLGYSPEEVMAQPLEQILLPESRAQVREKLAQLRSALASGQETEQDWRFEVGQRRKDGATVWTEVSATIIRDEQDRPVGIQGVSRDITERRLAYEAAAQALDELSRKTRVLERLLDGARAILAAPDFETVARQIFSSAQELTGAEAGYVAVLGGAGETEHPLFIEPGPQPCAAEPKLLVPLQGLRLDAYRSGQVVCENDFMNSPWAGLLPPGHVELRSVMLVPLTVGGQSLGIMGLANKANGFFTEEDMNTAAALGQLLALGLERWRAQQALEQNTSLLRIAGRMARLGGWSLDLDTGRLSWSDQVALIHEVPFGQVHSLEAALGFFAPECRPRITGALEACAREGTSYDGELELVTARGRRIWVRVIAEAIRDPSGAIRRIQGAMQDVTLLRQAEQERQKLAQRLEQAQRLEAIGRLAGGIAHDFNNLLSVILSYSGFALEAAPEGSALHADLKEVLRAGESAAALTRQLLAFSRRQTLEPRVLRLNQVLSSMEKMLRRLLGENIQIRIHLAPDLGNVLADPGQIEQVLLNLALNARDAMPEGGTLTIETANVALDENYAGSDPGVRPGAYVELTVSDTGSGMDATTREQIFEPFFTTKPKGQGTGLGLATVYGIVKQSGGMVSVDSEPGRGTTFKVYLPRVDASADEIVEPPVSTRSTGTETILVVEDEDTVRRIAERVLRGAGYQVHTAASGEAAVAWCEQGDTHVDLLLTDVVMPGMDGRELAERLRMRHPGLKVLFMSGYPDQALGEPTVLHPRTHLLSKPFTATELARKVRTVLDST